MTFGLELTSRGLLSIEAVEMLSSIAEKEFEWQRQTSSERWAMVALMAATTAGVITFVGGPLVKPPIANADKMDVGQVIAIAAIALFAGLMAGMLRWGYRALSEVRSRRLLYLLRILENTRLSLRFGQGIRGPLDAEHRDAGRPAIEKLKDPASEDDSG
jgi:hypothetical protein